ncbi:MAG: hypothetical protein FD129_2022, partial [bacterium]
MVPASLDFGSVCVGAGTERSLTLRNPGTTPFSGSVTILGPGSAVGPPIEPSEYSLPAGGGPFVLGAGESREVTVLFRPQGTGRRTGLLDFGTTACGSVSLAGDGGVPVVCQLSTTEIDFGSVAEGQSTTATFSINNAGCGTAVGFVSAGCLDFQAFEGAGAWTLGPGASRLVRVRFMPSAAGSVSCSLEIGGGCAPLPLRGLGVAVPVCAVLPELVDFGTVAPNQSRTSMFTIRNDGGGMLTGSIATGCDVFTVTAGAGAYSLGPGQSRTVTVRFQPTSAGERSCLLGLGGTECPGVTLVGAGDALPICSLSPSVLQFGGVTVNTSAEKSFVLRNVGGGTLGGTVSENCNEFEIIAGSGGYSLAGGESRTVTVRFRPTIQGQRTCGIGL